MAVNLDKLRARQFPLVRDTYSVQDTIRYALSVGVGMFPTEERHLRYVWEEAPKGLLVLPSMASVLAYAGHWSRDPELDLDWPRILHGEQRVVLHRSIPAAAAVEAQTRIAAVQDKGTARGAVMDAVREIRDTHTRQLIATVTMITFLRGDGGQGGFGQPSPPCRPVPDRTPDWTVIVPTSPQAGLLYRLEGDLNPVHADPVTASQAGFGAPIMHGLCTFGAVVHSLMGWACDDDSSAVRELAVRFTAPAYPGDVLHTQAWREGQNLRFRTAVEARGVTVLDRGLIVVD